MARYRPPKDLEAQIAARLTAPAVSQLARIAADGARRAAPATKHWVNMGDQRVRPEHRYVAPVPENLRFTLKTSEWEVRHDGIPPHQLAERPRDPSLSRGQLEPPCRCELSTQPSEIARAITAHPAGRAGHRVSARVTCEAELCVTAEFGTDEDDGARYLHQGLQLAREALRRH